MDDALAEFLSNINKTEFNISAYIKKVKKPWGHELIFTRDDEPYTGKIIHINSGKRLSLQVHDQKKESWFLLNGKANLIIEDSSGDLKEVELEQGKGYTTIVGQKHRLAGVEDADILEVSTPEIGNTYRLEDDYARPTETEELRKEENRGWKS